MNVLRALGLLAVLTLATAALPTSSAQCNIYYNAATRDCINGGTGTMSTPWVCSGVPCGTPCVLDTCVSRTTWDAYCVEFTMFSGNMWGEACVPLPSLF